MDIRICAREGCEETFVFRARTSRQIYCSRRCSAKERDQNQKTNPLPRAPRKSRAVVRPKLDARACRGCDQSFDPIRRNQTHCFVCRPVAEEFRRCDECQKPFRAASKASKFCGPDCRALWHDRMRWLDQRPVDGVDDDDDEEIVVLEIDDAPRRKRLFETLIRLGATPSHHRRRQALDPRRSPSNSRFYMGRDTTPRRSKALGDTAVNVANQLGVRPQLWRQCTGDSRRRDI